MSVKAGKQAVSGSLRLDAPKGWKVEPLQIPFQIKRKGEEVQLSFTVTPSAGPSDGMLTPYAAVGRQGIPSGAGSG
ncbi:MAG: hypothetical protein IPK21_13520 [Haliscomenobacter sp.]|nr:hypothetical protein [Haliscomenobacter sp.]